MNPADILAMNKRINDLEVLIDNLRVQLATHSHEAKKNVSKTS
jgi:hypothetical protein